MVLRRQELPDEDEFTQANERAAALLELARQPVRSARAVQALAGEVRREAGALLPPAESLVAELGRHAATLGLSEDSPRLVTARAAANLLNQLVGLTDATALLRALARAGLPREAAFYRASLSSARSLADRLAATNWQFLGQVAALAEGGGPDAERASLIGTELRDAARHHEQEIPLDRALRAADAAASALVLDIAGRRSARPAPVANGPGDGYSAGSGGRQPDDADQDRTGPVNAGGFETAAGGPGTVRRRATVSTIQGVIDELNTEVGSHPGATFEITWRVVTAMTGDRGCTWPPPRPARRSSRARCGRR